MGIVCSLQRVDILNAHAHTLVPVYFFVLFCFVFILNMRRQCAFFLWKLPRWRVCCGGGGGRVCLLALSRKLLKSQRLTASKRCLGLMCCCGICLCALISPQLFKRPSVVSFFSPIFFFFFELAKPRPVCRLAGCRLWDAQTTRQDFPKRGSRR